VRYEFILHSKIIVAQISQFLTEVQATSLYDNPNPNPTPTIK